MASILNQDFESESDEGNFNPEPADESDNEDARSQRDKKTILKARDRVHRPTVDDNDNEERTASPNPKGRQSSIDSTTSHDDGTGGEDGDENVHTNGKKGSGEAEEDSDEQIKNGDDEEDDDEDEEEEEEDAVSRRPRKRARKDPRNQYLDIMAEVDDEDEGEDEDDDLEAENFIAGVHPDDVADLPEDTAQDDRQHRILDAQRERRQQLDAEEEAQRLREKYGRRTAAASDSAIIPRRLLLPSVDDPSIWGVKCKPGKEREIVFAITKRIEERGGTKNPMPIISVFERGGSMAGYIYVETRRQADVIASLDGIMNVYPRTKIVLVPIKEMPDLLRVTKTEQLNPGGYVRLKRGKYAGDLAQIDEVETNGLEASLRIVPRLDYGQNEDNNAPMVDGNIKGDLQKRKRAGAMGLTNPAVRPPPRLFSEVEAKKRHSKYLQSLSSLGAKSWTYLNDTYVNGYLIKDIKVQHLITENVNPTLEEVTRFTAAAEDGTDNLDLTALAATLRKGTANENYLPGDVVEVYEGEQSGVVGKAVSVRGDIVTLSVIDGELRGQSIEVPTKGLRKRFREGDHVKVIGGSKYHDEVGMVVSIKGETVTFLSDLTLREISVFSKDLREASDSGVAGGLGRYDIHDLVQLDPATVGCIVKVDRESLRVVDQNGSIRSVMPSQISNKIEKRRHAVATDRNGSEIRMDDTIREIGGEQKIGVILHIHRSFLFIHNREQTENSGISVVRASNVATVAAKGGRVAQGTTGGTDLTKMNPALMRNGANGNPMAPPPKAFGRDRALGQTVTIRKGAYKGLLGIVKDTTDQEARVELHTKSKTITVAKDTLGFKDPLTGQSIDYTRFSASRGRGGGSQGGYSGAAGGRTPAHVPDWSGGARTPLAMAGGRTPAWGGGSAAAGSRTPGWSGANTARTPAYQSSMGGSRTPAYAPVNDGSRTVNPYADGSRTVNPYSSGSNRTPAWNPTATSASYSYDPFGAGSRTPAYEPSYSAASAMPDSLNPGYDAPTPAASAPTPGATNGYAGQTPAMLGQTPKFSGDAPTPFGGMPETPAWSGEDAGPRYEEGTPSP